MNPVRRIVRIAFFLETNANSERFTHARPYFDFVIECHNRSARAVKLTRFVAERFKLRPNLCNASGQCGGASGYRRWRSWNRDKDVVLQQVDFIVRGILPLVAL